MTRLRSLWRLWRLRHVQREIEVADAILETVEGEEFGSAYESLIRRFRERKPLPAESSQDEPV